MDKTVQMWFNLAACSLVGIITGSLLAFLTKLHKAGKGMGMNVKISDLKFLLSFIILSVLIPTFFLFVVDINNMLTINQYINFPLFIFLVSGLCKFLLVYKWELYIKK